MQIESKVITREIDGFYLQNASDSRKFSRYDFQGIPEIDAWVSLEKGEKTIIAGRIVNHPTYTQGLPIKTSSVEGYFSENGRVYINTKNSIYELGKPRNELGLIFSVPDINEAAKMTIWN